MHNKWSSKKSYWPDIRIDGNSGGPVQTGSDDNSVHVGVADVVAGHCDQPLLGLGDVHVSGEPVDGETADRPRRQELHQRRGVPAERVDDRLSPDRPRRRRPAVATAAGGTRLRPVDHAGRAVVVHRQATDATLCPADER